MAQANVSIRIDEDVKREAESLFAKLGLTLSAATNVFYRQAVRTQGIPFPITALPLNTSDGGFLLREALREAQEQAALNGTSEMTLDEINNIISEVRQENRR
ncbi:MAG: type II toxin-antitoxin system RelB/DinJ family antitoxin [Lachnospiraceae bacterium]|jgi:addiction module RelB/DinJ family antitoxin|nr:type II toxin-antitoxin system RelB/DinJ family antitoxin [Lachnospiraceae bacterium]